MKFVKQLNSRQSLWTVDWNFGGRINAAYFVCSTSFDGTEVFVFNSDETGEVSDFWEVYVEYDMELSHETIMKNFMEWSKCEGNP